MDDSLQILLIFDWLFIPPGLIPDLIFAFDSWVVCTPCLNCSGSDVYSFLVINTQIYV